MRTNNITKWAALLLTFSDMAASPLSLGAAPKMVTTTGTTFDSNNSYTSGGTGTAALFVTGSGVVYSGTNITATGTSALGNGRVGVLITNQAEVFLRSGTIVATDTGASFGHFGLSMSGSAKFTGENVLVDTLSGYSLNIDGSSEVNVSGLVVTGSGMTSRAVVVTGNSSFSGSNIRIAMSNSSGDVTRALTVAGGATADVTDVEIMVSGSSTRGLTVGESSAGILRARNVNIEILHDGGSGDAIFNGQSGVTEIDNLAINISGNRVRGIANSGMLTVNGGTINATHIAGANDAQLGAVALTSGVGGALTLNNVDVSAAGENYAALYTSNHNTTVTLVVNGGSLEAAQGSGVLVSGTGADDVDITLTGGVTVSGTSALEFVNTVNSSTVRVAVSNNSVLTGDINANEISNAVVNVTDSALTGNLSARDDAALTVTLDNSVLTGLSTISDNGVTNLTLNNGANWNMTGKSKVTTLSSSGGNITIANVEGDDLTVSNGITGQTALHLTLSDGVKSQTEIRVVVDETNAMSNSAFTLGSEVSNGMYDYVLENKTDGAWLIYTAPDPVDPITPPVISSEGDAVINTAAAVSGFWFTQLDNLHKRMGELRYNHSSSTTTLTGKDNKSVTLSGEQLLENIWIRAYGQQINASTNLSGVKGFSETQYGVDLGTDHLWNLDADNQLYTGIFAGYGGADRQFHSSYNGSTDSGYGGLYATWLNNSGWYADVVAKGQYFRNDFTGDDHAKYDSVGVGFSVEFGRQFEFAEGWFAEPSVQVSYLHLMNDNYTTTQGLSVDLADADVAQFYGGARFGRNLKLTNSGLLQPYIKAGGLGQISSGNTIRADGGKWRPNLDGARAVVGAGIIWQLNADSQLHLDYEASFGEKYDKPWGLTAGYRYQF